MPMNDDFYAAVQEVFDLEKQVRHLCFRRGELPLVEVERMTLAKGKRPWALFGALEEFGGFKVDFAKGKLYPPMSPRRARIKN